MCYFESQMPRFVLHLANFGTSERSECLSGKNPKIKTIFQAANLTAKNKL